jgi:hypothetical protein
MTFMNILLIGKRAKILKKIADELQARGHTAVVTSNLNINHLRALDVSGISCVVFGRALSAAQKDELSAHYKSKNPGLAVLDGWAPIPMLITYQILAYIKPITDVRVDGTKIQSNRTQHVRVTAYRLNWLYRARMVQRDITVTTEVIDLTDIFPEFRYFALESSTGYGVVKT